MNKALLALSITILSGSLLAQESPITPRAERVQISEGTEVPLVGGYLTVIRWTVNNPGGLPVHYGVVHYGSDPKDLSQTAKNSIRLNPNHSSTVFRVNLYDLPPRRPTTTPWNPWILVARATESPAQYKTSRHRSGALSP